MLLCRAGLARLFLAVDKIIAAFFRCGLGVTRFYPVFSRFNRDFCSLFRFAAGPDFLVVLRSVVFCELFEYSFDYAFVDMLR